MSYTIACVLTHSTDKNIILALSFFAHGSYAQLE